MDFLLALDWGDVVETLLGVIVGGLIALGASVMVQRMQSAEARELQREQREHDREQQRAQWNYEQDVEHARYQRDTLAELQAHLDELVSTARSVDSELMDMYRNATPEQLESNKIETSEHYQAMMRRFRDANQQVRVLGVRIESETICEQLEDIHRLALKLVYTPPAFWEELARAGELGREPSWEIVDLAMDANKAIGTAIRSRAPIVRPD
jgi:hypothetical protein